MEPDENPEGLQNAPKSDAANPQPASPSPATGPVWDAESLLRGQESRKDTSSQAKEEAPPDVRAAKAEKRAKASEEERRDPTAAFQSGSYSGTDLPQEVQAWTTKLRDNRMLLLSSHDPELLYAVAQEILLHPWFASCEKRDVSSESHELDVDQFIQAAAGAKPRVIVAYAMHPMSSPFLRTLRPDIPIVSRQTSDLRDANMFLLIVARTSLLGEIERRDPTQKFPFIEPPVSFLEPRLRAEFRLEAADIAAKVRYQRDHRLWGASEERFLVNLKERIADGTLRATLADYEEAIKTGKVETLRDQQQPVMALQLLDAIPDGDTELQQLYQWVLFTATFFPDIPMDEFSQILKQIIPSPPPGSAATEGAKAARSKSLFEAWPLNEPKILRLCQIRQEPRKLDAPAIGFIEGVLRSEMEAAFRSTYYGHYTRAVRSIEEGGLVADGSPLIRRAVVELLATRATSEANYFGRRYALDILYSYARARSKNGSAPASSAELIRELENLPQETCTVLFAQLAAVIVTIANIQPSIAEDGLTQLKSIGILGPIRNVMRRFSRVETPPVVLAAAARILLSSGDFVIFAETLNRVRRTLCERSKGPVLTLLMSTLPRDLGCSVLRYLSHYALMGFRLDAKANPIATALVDLSVQPESKTADLAPLAAILLADDFPKGFDDEDTWELFHTWLAPEALRKDRLLLLPRLVPAMNAAALRLYTFLQSRVRSVVSPNKIWLAAMTLADTYSRIENPDTQTKLAAAISNSLERQRRAEFSLLLNELGNAINAGVLSLQAPGEAVNRSEQQKRSQFLARWKRLRDALRQLKSDIDRFPQTQPASA